VLAQEAQLVFGSSPAGRLMFFALQAATAAINPRYELLR
jgi:hypothetical protein